MTQKTRVSVLIRLFLLFKLATAYLEPGSSSFLLKILISSLVALVVFFRQIWGYTRLLLAKLGGKRGETLDQSTAVPAQSPQNEIQ